MYRVQINTSDLVWAKRHAVGEPTVSGEDCQHNPNYRVTIEVDEIERVTFAGAQMIRFDIGCAPRDHNRYAMYPATYLVCEPTYHEPTFRTYPPETTHENGEWVTTQLCETLESGRWEAFISIVSRVRDEDL